MKKLTKINVIDKKGAGFLLVMVPAEIVDLINDSSRKDTPYRVDLRFHHDDIDDGDTEWCDIIQARKTKIPNPDPSIKIGKDKTQTFSGEALPQE